MKKLFTIFLYILTSCASEPIRKESDPLKELLIAMGAVDVMNYQVASFINIIREKNAENENIIRCLEGEFTTDAIIDRLRPHYYKIITEDELLSLNNFFKTPSGRKFLSLSKYPSLYDAKTSFSESEREEIEPVLVRFGNFFGAYNGIVLTEATRVASQEIVSNMIKRCGKSLP